MILLVFLCTLQVNVPKESSNDFLSNGLKDYMDINSVEKTSANKNDLIIQTLKDLSQDALKKLTES